jgi:hypothetical protein
MGRERKGDVNVETGARVYESNVTSVYVGEVVVRRIRLGGVSGEVV